MIPEVASTVNPETHFRDQSRTTDAVLAEGIVLDGRCTGGACGAGSFDATVHEFSGYFTGEMIKFKK